MAEQTGATRKRLNEIIDAIHALQREARELVIGQRIRITGRYNGQPYGRSAPSLTGREFSVKSVGIDGSSCALLPEGESLYISIRGVAFEDDDV